MNCVLPIRLLGSVVLLFAAIGSPGIAAEALKPGELRSIATQAYIYGFPMVMNYGTLYEYAIHHDGPQYKAPFNVLYNTARVYTPADTTIVTPNSDTPYSFVTADLRGEPLVVSVPDVEAGRYSSVQLIDMYTCNYGYLGSRTTGNKAGDYIIAGPHWQGAAPAGVRRVFRCETDFSMVIFRTQLFGPNDLEEVKRIQAGYQVRPLSAYVGQKPAAAAATITWPPIDKQRSASDPFEYLGFLLQFCPPLGSASVEKPLRAQFSRIGIEAGKPFSTDSLTSDQKTELAEGMQAGLKQIQQSIAQFGAPVNGWRIGSPFGDRAFYQGDWLKRAGAAMAGIYGNDSVEALYPMLATDSQGNRPNCAAQRYTLTFPSGELPPVNAFWSVTMYDARTQLLVENPIDRYLINSPMLGAMKKGSDGSLTIYVQKDSPGSDKESNWLPAPGGPIYVVMRLYWPKPEAINGSWKPPAVVPIE